MLKGFECSVIVCTYNPSWDRLRLTLKSLLMQENCAFKIIVVDDGSVDNIFDKVNEFFMQHSFTDYDLLASDKNCGTVINILRGLKFCEGEYVKPISPGDCLHGAFALRNWIDFMNKHPECIMSYCDVICYRLEHHLIKPLIKRAAPQSIKPTVKEYLMYRDFCLGAATLVRRNPWVNYLEMLRGKVIYTEDSSYQIMIYMGENFIRIPQSLLLYEFGCGVTTSGNREWIKLIKKDEKVVNDIIAIAQPCDEAAFLRVKTYLRYRDLSTWKSRLMRKILLPSSVWFSIKRKFFPRKTSVMLENKFVLELLN